MSDWVISTADQATMRGLMQQMDYWSDGAPVFTGPLPDGSGQYFLNDVGTVYDDKGAAQPGWWARLRLNGNDPFASGALDIPEGVTVFPPVKYLDDHTTIDESYIQPSIGLIA